ncbi:MAG: tetratricopeptide repeat protein, partial [Chloroflexi bacterium]|nr:tetratricopeptide repeat protein [Chloroflexota bacterium]
VGKTRLALRVAEAVRDRFADGVWLVELAALAEPTLVAVAVAVARELGVRDQRLRPLAEALAAYLRPRSVLLILDNCEQLLDGCATLADALLRACPRLRVLATSRARLGLGGEVAWQVPSLTVPSAGVEDATSDPGRALLSSEAGRLFVERASEARPGFELTAANAAAGGEVCRRLDGIPLAIELAAARVRVLSVEEIVARLDDRFALLTGGSRTSLPRQQTLRALVDWSHDLLADAERTLLRRLSVFAGGWTLEAAERVGSGEEPAAHCLLPTAHSVLDLLAGLVDKSLVVAEELDGVARYGLLETIRQYAAERLREAGEESTLRDRHCEWFLACAERAEPELVGPDQVRWLDRLEADHGNLRAALRWCLQRPDAESGLRFGSALWRFWEGRNHLAEGRAWLDEVLALEPPAARPVLECRAQFAAGRLALLQGDREAAGRILEPCLARGRNLGDPDLVAITLAQLGHLNRDRGELAEARSQYEAGLRIWRERGDARGIALSLLNLGRLDLMEGATDEGRALLEESLSRYRELGDPTDISRVLLFVGGIACDLGRLDEARARYAEGLRIAVRLRDRGRVCANLEGCAVLAAAEGQPERALGLAAVAATLREAIGTAMGADEQRRLEARLAPIRRALGESRCAQLFEQARGMAIDQAIAYALDGEGEVSTDGGPSVHGGDDQAGLTPREQDVAGLVARGLPNREIADALVLSERTVEWHVGNILGKLRLDSRAQLAVWAAEHGPSSPRPE